MVAATSKNEQVRSKSASRASSADPSTPAKGSGKVDAHSPTTSWTSGSANSKSSRSSQSEILVRPEHTPKEEAPTAAAVRANQADYAHWGKIELDAKAKLDAAIEKQVKKEQSQSQKRKKHQAKEVATPVHPKVEVNKGEAEDEGVSEHAQVAE